MDREPVVTLSKWELVLGAIVGCFRAIEVLLGQWENRARGIDADGRIWTRHIEGALAELAAAKVLDRHWTGSVGTFKGGDVGRLQVRARLADLANTEKRLIVQPQDDPGQIFLLVVGHAPSYRIVGWIEGSRAKSEPGWIQNPGGYGEAFFVPQDVLHPLRTLDELKERAA